jgi:hypothetical protein
MSGVVCSCSPSSEAEWLAGVAATDEVNGFNLTPIDRRDVAEVRHIGPVLREHPAGVGVDLGLPADGHPGPLEPEVEPTDAGEQGAGGERHGRCPVLKIAVIRLPSGADQVGT